jgi:4-methylaminobutanoate oxidase (formaldehyde-forming)
MIEADEPVAGEYLKGGSWEVEIADGLHPATVSILPLYDPKSERVRM